MVRAWRGGGGGGVFGLKINKNTITLYNIILLRCYGQLLILVNWT